MEGGFRLGKWRHARSEDEKAAPVGTIVAAVLGLLAFLLAFTFQMAASRFESRRLAVLEEANAIHTAYLRTGLLPEPQRTETARLLREYVDLRVRAVAEANLAEGIARSEELQERLWVEAVKAAQNKDGTPALTSLFIQSLNGTIELHAKRVLLGIRSRIPLSIWVSLFCLALLTMAAVGYHAGLSSTRRSIAMLGMVVAFAAVLFLIADLDRPGEGFLSVSQQAMVDLQRLMHASRP
jgi:hypothetical protein